MAPRSLRARLIVSYIVIVVAVTTVGFAAVKLMTPAFYEQRVRARVGLTGGRGFGQGGSSAPVDGASPVRIDAAYEEALNTALIIAAAVGLALAILLAVWLSRRIVSRLDAVRAATLRLAGGDYTQEIPLPPEAELAELTRSVNALRYELQETELTRAQLVSDLSHELRNPLATIEGYMEGLIDGVLPATDATFTTVATETHRLQRLTEDLSLLSRAQEGALDINLTTVSLHEVATSVILKLQPQYSVKGVTLTSAVTEPLEVVADSDRLVQALTNVVGNALTNTPAGGTVRVAGTRRDGRALLEVIDTGVGIPPQQLEAVFERFTRLNPESSGTGIGLSVARALLRRQHGELTAHSEGLGTGTTFTFTLPLAGDTAIGEPDGIALRTS